MAMEDATIKRKEPEAPTVAVAVKTAASDEPEAKRLKPTPLDPTVVRKQVEYYMSNDNLKFDKFFHDKISGNSEGWLEISMILSCNKMKSMRCTKEDVAVALKDSKIEMTEDGLSIRRPGNLALPALESRPTHQKKNVNHHVGGVVALFNNLPEGFSWMQLKDTLRVALPPKVSVWFVSEVNDKMSCIVAVSPFEGDMKFFEEMKELEVGDARVKAEVAHGDALQNALKVLPKHIRDKREKEARKRQKEKNRPIVVGSQRFVNVAALRGRVKEILNSRSDGEHLKPEGSDYKLITSVLSFHPKGAEKGQGLVGIKVGTSIQGGNRCFWMVKEDGKEDDFSMVKCIGAIEANPPYVEMDKEKKPAEASPAKPEEKTEAASTSAPAVVEKKAEVVAAPAVVEEKKKEVAAPAPEPAAVVAAAPAAEEKKGGCMLM